MRYEMTKIWMILLVFCAASNIVKAQLSSEQIQSEKKIIENDFKNVLSTDLVNLIPFYVKGKGYGYYNIRTQKECVPPRYTRLDFISFYENSNIGYITSSDFKFYINPGEQFVELRFGISDDIPVLEAMYRGEEESTPKASDKVKGFKLNEQNELISYSSSYDDFTKWNNPFLIGKKYHLRVTKNNREGIVNEKGKSLKGFDFLYKKLIRLNCVESGEIWFILVDDEKNLGLIQINGEVKFYKEMGLFDYYTSVRPIRCYGIRKVGEQYGIMDYHRMDWLIAPQSDFAFGNINYIRYSKDGTYNGASGEKNDHVYFEVIDENVRYYIDVNQNKLIPEMYVN